MRIFLICVMLTAESALAQVQTSPPAPPKPPAPASRPPATSSRGGVTFTITDTRGEPLAGVHVEVLGVSDRSGDSTERGQVTFSGLSAGSYRVRFSGDPVVTYEREITIRAGRTAPVDITLNAAPPPEAPPPPPSPEPAEPVASAVGPIGQLQTVSIVDLVERELIGGNQPNRDTLIACSGNTRTTLVQLNQPRAERQYESAEISYYVVAGEGTLTAGGRDTALAPSSFASLPRGTTHSLMRRGRRPLIVLVTLSGAPCEEAR